MIITGGGRGIGAATALLAAERGYAVVVNYLRDAASANAVVQRISAAGGRALAVAGDVAQSANVEQLFERADAFGPLAALVNNAGIVEPNSRMDEIDQARLRRIFEVNVQGSFLCAREAVRRLSSRHGGRGGVIVNVSSAAVKHGSPGAYVDYAASKAAVETLTLGLAREVASEGIRVNAVRPGVIDTEIHASGGDPERVHKIAPSLPMQRAGTADEVAKAILWLCSSEASYSTGSILEVTGGR
jgi:NAD(P)-dependent dehydrogenase (short-subunit alcohol dehydrogenase family)